MCKNILDEDLLQRIGGLPSTGELAAARIQRDAATVHTQGSYDSLFRVAADAVDELPLGLRIQVGASVARWNGGGLLEEHYGRLAAGNSVVSELLSDALQYAERVTQQPGKATPEHLQYLLGRGWSLPSIVTLAQAVAFVNFQIRLLQGFRLLAGFDTRRDREKDDRSAAAAAWRAETRTLGGRLVPSAFTQKELEWEPWIAPRTVEDLSESEVDTLARFGQLNSNYFRLLAWNLPVLEQRTLVDRGIFFTPEGLPRAERELAATVTSKINGCIYCASVHARRAIQLSKREAEVEQLLAVLPGDELSGNFEPRWKAEIDFAAELAATPPRVSHRSFKRLQEQGLGTLEILDLVQSVAFFSWANRLMLTLGEPFVPVVNR
jgi:alkylhydroperoxidase domain protein